MYPAFSGAGDGGTKILSVRIIVFYQLSCHWSCA